MRDKVWLGVSAVVINEHGEWLVVKKQYSGLKGMWSMTAGFVENGETIDQAILRELKEETGIEGMIKGVIGVRSGVIKDIISDNMIVFLVDPLSSDITVTLPNDEIEDVQWRTTESLLSDSTCSPMIHEFIRQMNQPLPLRSTQSPGIQFNYTKYHLFF